MITVEQKQAIIENAFNNARGLDELRWLNGIFANILASLPLLNQFQLSDVLESRVTEVQGVDDAEGRDQVGTSQSHAEEQPDTEGSVAAPWPDAPRGEGLATALPTGSDGSLRAQGGG